MRMQAGLRGACAPGPSPLVQAQLADDVRHHNVVLGHQLEQHLRTCVQGGRSATALGQTRRARGEPAARARFASQEPPKSENSSPHYESIPSAKRFTVHRGVSAHRLVRTGKALQGLSLPGQLLNVDRGNACLTASAQYAPACPRGQRSAWPASPGSCCRRSPGLRQSGKGVR